MKDLFCKVFLVWYVVSLVYLLIMILGLSHQIDKISDINATYEPVCFFQQEKFPPHKFGEPFAGPKIQRIFFNCKDY